MRRSFISVLLVGAACGAGAQEDELALTPDSGIGSSDLPAGALVFHGRSGVGPKEVQGELSHAETIQHLGEAGLQVLQSAQWPETLDDLRLLLLSAPGYSDSSDHFSSLERSQIYAMAERGGVVVAVGENTSLLNPEVLNQLVWDLGASMYIEGGSQDGTAQDIGEHVLSEGIQAIGYASAASVEPGDATCLAAEERRCVAAAHAIGSGWLVLHADGDLLDALAQWEAASCDNLAYLENLAQLY